MYRLAKDTDIAYPTLWKLNTGRAQRIGFDILEKICLRLDCSPGDLLSVEQNEEPKKAQKQKGRREE